MKHIKLFEEYDYRNYEDNIIEMKKHNIGDIISYERLHNYANALHNFQMEDYDDDEKFITDHILKYPKFILTELNIKDLDLYPIDPTIVDEYIDLYKETNWYPPIIYDKEEDLIIDGYHRTTVLDKLGEEKILAWVGI